MSALRLCISWSLVAWHTKVIEHVAEVVRHLASVWDLFGSLRRPSPSPALLRVSLGSIQHNYELDVKSEKFAEPEEKDKWVLRNILGSQSVSRNRLTRVCTVPCMKWDIHCG